MILQKFFENFHLPFRKKKKYCQEDYKFFWIKLWCPNFVDPIDYEVQSTAKYFFLRIYVLYLYLNLLYHQPIENCVIFGSTACLNYFFSMYPNQNDLFHYESLKNHLLFFFHYQNFQSINFVE